MAPRLLAVAGALALGACVPNVGPTTVQPARAAYNQHIAQSSVEQLLLNIVRLRYRDSPSFLEVASVLTQYEISGQARIGDVGYTGSDGAVALGGAQALVAERPTITYTPLTGEAFVRRLIAPLPLASINLLAGSGWSIERLMLCCIDDVNGVQNAPGAAGPTPAVLRFDPRFRNAARVMRQLQASGAVSFVRPTDSAPTGRIRLRPEQLASAQDTAAYEGLVDALRLRRGQREFKISSEDDARQDVLHVSLRSLMGALFYLSHTVEIPEEHRARGFVTRTTLPDGTPVDWLDVTGGIFRVRSGKAEPGDAYAAVRHRGHWFWIPDDDLETKTTLGMLSYLLQLQSVGSPQGLAPLITVPASR